MRPTGDSAEPPGGAVAVAFAREGADVAINHLQAERVHAERVRAERVRDIIEKEGRAGQPTELAPAHVLLASPESSCVVGESLVVNGGTPMP